VALALSSTIQHNLSIRYNGRTLPHDTPPNGAHRDPGARYHTLTLPSCPLFFSSSCRWLKCGTYVLKIFPFEFSILFSKANNKIKFTPETKMKIQGKKYKERHKKETQNTTHKHNTRFRFMLERGSLDSDHPQHNRNFLCQIHHNPRQILTNLTDPFPFFIHLHRSLPLPTPQSILHAR